MISGVVGASLSTRVILILGFGVPALDLEGVPGLVAVGEPVERAPRLERTWTRQVGALPAGRHAEPNAGSLSVAVGSTLRAGPRTGSSTAQSTVPSPGDLVFQKHKVRLATLAR